MKKLLSALIIAAFAMPVYAADAKKADKPAAAKKVKKHKKAEGTKIPEAAPKAPAKKDTKKK